jgi:hypothetical protein
MKILYNNPIKSTIYISLFVQIITTLVSYDGLYSKLNDNDKILQDILSLEVIVQIIEASFYIWVIFALSNLESMTPRRYIDWVITTPTMLLSTIIFMKYQEYKETNKNVNMKFFEFLKEHKSNITKIFIYNALMLLFGFLGETNMIDKNTSIVIGFVFFYLSFNTIYHEYAKKSKQGIQLFIFLITVWALYGVAAMLDVQTKNISYNLLDIVSKNFYGLFIYYKVIQESKNYKKGINDLPGLI